MEALPSYNDRGPLADDSFSSSNAHFALDPQLAQLDVPTDPLDLLGPSSDHPYSTHDLDQDPHRQHPFLGHHDASPSFFNPSFGYAPMDTPLDQSFSSHPDMSVDAYGPSSSHNADGFLPDQSFPHSPQPVPSYALQEPTLPPYGAQSGSVASGFAGEPSGSNKGKGKKAEKDKPAEKGVVKKTSGNGSRGPRGPYKKRPKIQITPDSECSFCDGTNERNRDGKPEEMISCFSCGRSGHPSCLQMQTTKLIRSVRSYAWKCIECKTCEACQVKGDDTKLLFCDYCDRGYHLDCLDPPLTQPPKGSWGCPQCRKPRPSGVSSTSASSSKTPNRHAQASAETPQTASRSSVAKGKQPASLKLRMRRRSSEEDVEEEEDGKPKEPFGGVLRGADADTSRSKIQEDDLARFEASWTAAEAKLGEPRPTESSSFTPTTSRYASPSAFSSSQQRPRDRLSALQTNDPSSRYSSPAPSSSSHLQPYETPTPSLEKIKRIRFGKFDIDIWYSAPYPEEYALVPDGRLWMCEFCLKYMKSSFGAERHKLKCKARHPPGDEVYREGSVSVFEVDGRKNKIYCQNLCLLAKMFLDHKTLYYDIEPFLFYIMTETDEAGARFVGYFSKEKRSPMEYNVSCILTLPVRQRKGWGNLLIDFSYLLSKKEARVGSPEKPLSSLGLLSYTKYWTTAVFAFLKTAQRPVTIEQISSSTSMTPEDIIFTLTSHQMITIAEPASPPALLHSSSSPNHAEPNAAPRGLALRNLVSADTATTVSTATASGSTRETDLKLASALAVPKAYTIDWNPAVVEEYLAKFENKGWLKTNPIKLSWSPFLLEARSSLTVLARETGVPVVVEPAKQEATELPSHGILADTLVPQTVAVSIDVDMEAAPDQREPVQAAVEV